MILSNKTGIDEFQSSLQQHGLQGGIEQRIVERFCSLRLSEKVTC